MGAITFREGPYHYERETDKQQRKCGDKQLTLILSTAFNAGIIGPEFNGIVVLNDTDLQVVLDQECPIDSGYFGASAEQRRRFEDLLAMPDDDFLRWATNHSRYRQGSLVPEAVKPIPPSYDWSASASYAPEVKREFHRVAESRLHALAKALGYGKADYDLRHNQGGVAVSGEITLHSDELYVQVSQSCMGIDSGILYRECDGRKDYTGHRNNFAPLGMLDTPTELARHVGRLVGR